MGVVSSAIHGECGCCGECCCECTALNVELEQLEIYKYVSSVKTVVRTYTPAFPGSSISQFVSPMPKNEGVCEFDWGVNNTPPTDEGYVYIDDTSFSDDGNTILMPWTAGCAGSGTGNNVVYVSCLTGTWYFYTATEFGTMVFPDDLSDNVTVVSCDPLELTVVWTAVHGSLGGTYYSDSYWRLTCAD